MEYKPGFQIKPYEVTALGQVFFTDGTTNNLVSNQLQCEAYGYTYDRTSGTCRAFRFTPLLPVAEQNTNNILNGPGNTTEVGSNSIQMNGSGHSTGGNNTNCLINGRENTLARGIDNASILGGSMGMAVRQGEIVLGGGSDEGLVGIRKIPGLSQSSKIQLSATTTHAITTPLNVQGLTDAFIELQRNSILGFEIYVTRLETGGTSGTAGNFHYLVIKGAARCQGSTGAITLYTYSTTTIASLGSAAITPAVMYDSSTGGIPSITVNVTDLANRDNVWSATAYLHELRTTITF